MYGAVEKEARPTPVLHAESGEDRKRWRVWAAVGTATVFALGVIALSSQAEPDIHANGMTKYSALSADAQRALFEQFKSEFRKEYLDADEEEQRWSAFQDNLDLIDSLNAQGNGVTYKLNQFADLTQEEFKEYYLTFGKTKEGTTYSRSIPRLPGEVPDWTEDNCQACKRYPELANYTYDNLPESWDWRDYGAVTDVKNQANCGSCWAFSAIGDVEGSWYLAGNNLTMLSEQQLVACDTNINSGCYGGWPELAFMYMQNAGGLVTEDGYPYKNVNMYRRTIAKPNCDVSVVQKRNYAARIDFWQKVSSSASEEYKMELALIKSGPLSVALNADGMSYYSSGVDKPKNCDASGVDHAVLLVGYGVEDGDDYWLIKNSWATTWGEDGYYKLLRGTNACGIAEYVTHTIVTHTTVGRSD